MGDRGGDTVTYTYNLPLFSHNFTITQLYLINNRYPITFQIRHVSLNLVAMRIYTEVLYFSMSSQI